MATPETSVAARYGGFDLTGLQRPTRKVVPYSEWALRVRAGAQLDVQRIDAAIRYADAGLMWPLTDLTRESLGLNPHAQGILGKRILPLSTCDWDLSPAEGDGVSKRDAVRIATEVRVALSALNMQQAIHDLAFAYLDGRSALEVEWARTRNMMLPRDLHWLVPQRLSFGSERELIVVDRWNDQGMFTPRGPRLRDQPGRFIEFLPRMFGDLQEREGLAPRYVYWLFFDRFGWRHRILLTESFGLPWRMVETSLSETFGATKLPRVDGAPDDSLGYAADEAENVTRDGVWIGLPGQTMHVEYPPAELEDFFGQTSDQILARLEVLTLHTSSTTSSDPSRAGAIVLKSAEETLFQAGGRALGGVIQRSLIDVIVELNYGASALPLAPKFQIRTQPERDRKSELERADLMVNKLRVPLSRPALYEASGFRPPNPGEELVEPAEIEPALPPGGAPPALPSASAKPRPKAATSPEDAGSSDAAGALKDLLEGADEEDQRDAADAEADLTFARLRLASQRNVQPSIANGSPDVLVERGAREGARSAQRWVDELLDVADGGDAARIYRRLDKAAAFLDLETFARAVERRIVHGLMLGGLDADYEATQDVAIAPAAFTIAPQVGVRDFVTLPFGEAIQAFASRKILTKRAFDRLLGAAKRKAFTVAGLARKSMVGAAHDELAKAIERGDDLRGFSSMLTERFDSAGWTKLNPSHVETVFRNGVMGAYADGRDAQMTQPAVLEARPFWQVFGVDDDRARKTHKAAHGKVLRADDPFWTRAPLPWGHNCRDRKVSRSAADLKRLGLTVSIGASLRGLPDDGWSSDGMSLAASRPSGRYLHRDADGDGRSDDGAE